MMKAYSTGNYADVVLLATRFETTGELDGERELGSGEPFERDSHAIMNKSEQAPVKA